MDLESLSPMMYQHGLGVAVYGLSQSKSCWTQLIYNLVPVVTISSWSQLTGRLMPNNLGSVQRTSLPNQVTMTWFGNDVLWLVSASYANIYSYSRELHSLRQALQFAIHIMAKPAIWHHTEGHTHTPCHSRLKHKVHFFKKNIDTCMN